MKRTKLYPILFIVVIALTLSLSVSAFGLEETYDIAITVGASAPTVSSGDTIELTVTFEQNIGFKNAFVDISYDPELVTYVAEPTYTDTVFAVDGDKEITFTESNTKIVTGTGMIRVSFGTMMELIGSVKFDGTGEAIVLKFKVNENVSGDQSITFTVDTDSGMIKDDVTNSTVFDEVYCGSTTVQYIDSASHQHTIEVIPGTPATCTQDGTTDAEKCTTCGEIIKDHEVITAKGHADEVIPAVSATCSQKGSTEGTKCSVCGEILLAPTETDMLEHTLVVVEEGYPATCITLGMSDKIACSVCGFVSQEQEEIAMLDHDWVESTVMEATCTEAGFSGGTECSFCGEIGTVPTVIVPLGHDPKVVDAVPATCTETGLSEGSVCSRCDVVLKAQEEVPILDHTLTEIPENPATCTEPGTGAGEWCPVCQLVTVIPEELPALDHDYVAVVTAPTCIAEGFTTHTCSRCEDSYTDTPTEKVAHTIVKVEGKPATCTETGLTEGEKCSVCGYEEKAQEVIEKLDHTDEYVPAKTPTCTETGLTSGVKCAVCGQVLTEQSVVPATGHNEIDVMGYPATYEQPGLTDGKKCTVCGVFTVPQKVISALKHTVEIIPAVEPTCTETGLTEGQKCVGCCNGAILVEQEVIPALGHDHKAVVTAPTCIAEGYTTYTCTRCGDSYTDDTTAKLPHNEITVVGNAATCTATGLTDGTKCADCGEVTKAQEEIAKLSHSFGDWVVVKEATATEDGSQVRACTACDATENQVIPAKGEEPSTQPSEPETQPSVPATQPTEPVDNSNTVLIIAVVALFIAAAAIIVLLILKKK